MKTYEEILKRRGETIKKLRKDIGIRQIGLAKKTGLSQVYIENCFTKSSSELIGSVKERFKELEYKDWDYKSFYNGWLEGRFNLIKPSQKK